MRLLRSVQSLSHVRLFVTLWTAEHQASLSITNSWSLLSIVHWVGDAIQPSHPSSTSPALNLSQHQGPFKWVSSPHQVAKVLEFQLQHQSLQWTPRTDFLSWLDLLAVQGTLKILLQHCSSKASINTKNDVLFFIGNWNAKVRSQEISGVTGKFGLGVQNKAGQRLTEFCYIHTSNWRCMLGQPKVVARPVQENCMNLS